MGAIAFYILSFLTVTSALMVVFSKKPVHSVLYLIFCFFTMAGHYVILNAQFLAAVHVIVYAGAIMVLFLFVIILLNLNQQVQENKRTMLRFAAVVTSGLMLLVLVASMKGIGRLERATNIDSEIGLVKNLGLVLYNEYMMPFETLSVLFLAAMVGSVMIGKKEKA